MQDGIVHVYIAPLLQPSALEGRSRAAPAQRKLLSERRTSPAPLVANVSFLQPWRRPCGRPDSTGASGGGRGSRGFRRSWSPTPRSPPRSLTRTVEVRRVWLPQSGRLGNLQRYRADTLTQKLRLESQIAQRLSVGPEMHIDFPS